ncbi:hypothetical protein HAX54_025219 [Datura stramonium]|uniref:Uncharacterized protein n=1 Tax=Datura stramonium TaxID=4076 RepID=A0ABS8S613_DATST|nr:hypothetical protein [Datura stramonium]
MTRTTSQNRTAPEPPSFSLLPPPVRSRSPASAPHASVSTARCEGSCSWSEPRRRSCDDRSSRNTLENLFGVDDECLSTIVEHKESEEVRVRADALVRIVDIEEDIQDGELKTMKESSSISGISLPKITNRGFQRHCGYKSKESRSEIGECAMGRRSCDTEARFSADVGRLSLDGPRISIDELKLLGMDIW